MTAGARHMLFRTNSPNVTPADVERWAAAEGCIVTAIREIPDTRTVWFRGEWVRPGPGCHVWTAEIVAEEGNMTEYCNACGRPHGEGKCGR